MLVIKQVSVRRERGVSFHPFLINWNPSLNMAATASDFVTGVIDAYQDFYKEIQGGTHNELDLIPRLARLLFCNDTLGWNESDYAQEDDQNDVRLYDEERNPVIIIEAKRRDRDVEEGIDQAFRYASSSPYVEYLIATNFDELLLYRRCHESEADETRYGVSSELLSHIRFESIIDLGQQESLVDDVPQEQIDAIRQLTRLKKEDLVNPDRYEDFDVSDRQDVSTDEGFDNLLDSLTTSLDEYWMPYTVRAFDEYQDRYEEYRQQANDLESQIESLEEQGHEDDTEIVELKAELADLRDEYERYRAFNSDYRSWVRLSNRQENDEEENKRVFCRESIYVQMNKVLLIRIAEDKGLTEQMVSDGGVTDYFEFWDDFARYVNRNYVDLFEVASEELSEIYDRLYSRQIFDWEISSDDEDLDDVLKKTFWHLNHSNFQDVDRDVLGHLYERHLPPEERKELGEFYTPTAVVDFILDRVGYTTENPIEQPEADLLDPACGSGTFLVRAAGRLLKRLNQRNVPPREAIDIMLDRLWGFDLNPFACHITEMNLLFQVIDLYKDVKEEDPEYTLDRFNIYQTDSLRRQTQTQITTTYSDALVRKYERERRQADRAKTRGDYGYVVMNPPYVRIQNIPDGPAKEDYDDYYSAYHNYDLYLLFIEAASEWLSEGGQLGIITSNQFIESRYGEKAREMIPQRYRIGEMVNIGDVDVFAHATTYPTIMSLERSDIDRAERSADDYVVDDYRFSYVSVNNSMEDWIESDAITGWGSANGDSRGEERNYRIVDLIDMALPGDWGDEPPSFQEIISEQSVPVPEEIDFDEQPPLNSYPVQSEAISDSEWQFAPADEQEVLNAMEETGENLRTYCHNSKVERGLRTGKNPVFIVDSDTIEKYDLEQELVHPLVGGRDVKRWEHLWKDQYIIYTPPGMDIDEYPNTVEYYNAGDNREELEDRYCVREQDEDYWALDKPKDPELFEQTKIVTPDIAYYNNYWLDRGGKFYCLDTTYYISPSDEEQAWYLAGLLNSDIAQFYIRRNAAKYRGNYLRYKSDYVEKIPIPDPEEVSDELVTRIEETAKEKQSLLREYRAAEQKVESPDTLVTEDDIDTVGLSRTAYVSRIPDATEQDSDVDVSVRVEGSTVHLNVQDTVELRGEEEAEAFTKYVEIFEFDSVLELVNAEYPRTTDGLLSVHDRYEMASDTVENARELLNVEEAKLHDAAYEAFGIIGDKRDLVEDRVETPESALDSNVR
jgi:type I restriction-modification system DNA methylase subunit